MPTRTCELHLRAEWPYSWTCILFPCNAVVDVSSSCGRGARPGSATEHSAPARSFATVVAVVEEVCCWWGVVYGFRSPSCDRHPIALTING